MDTVRDAIAVVLVVLLLAAAGLFFVRAGQEILSQPPAGAEGEPRWQKANIDNGRDIWWACVGGNTLYSENNTSRTAWVPIAAVKGC